MAAETLNSLVGEIDRLCIQHGELDGALTATVEEAESKRQQLKSDIDRVIEKLNKLTSGWAKEHNSSVRRLLESVSKLNECSSKMFPSFAATRLQATQEEIKRKLNPNDSKVQAMVNVNLNLNIDRDRNGTKIREKKVITKSFPIPARLINNNNGVDQNNGSPSIDTQAERTPMPPGAIEKEEDRTSVIYFDGESSTKSSSDVRAERTKKPAWATATMASEEKTQNIYYKTGNEDEGGVEPDLDSSMADTKRPRGREVTNRKKGVESRATEGSSTSLGRLIDEVHFNTGIGQNVQDSNEQATRTQNGTVQTTKRQFLLSQVWLTICTMIILGVVGPILIGLLYGSISITKATGKTFSVAMEEIICGIANEICETYGRLCYDRCASGLEQKMWKHRRG